MFRRSLNLNTRKLTLLLLPLSAGQPQKALQKVQEGIRQQAVPVGRLEELQTKLLSALPSTNDSTSVEHPSPFNGLERQQWPPVVGSQPHTVSSKQPSPLVRSHSLDRVPSSSLAPQQDAPSAHPLRQQQVTPSAYKHQPFQPSLQAIPSLIPSDEQLDTPVSNSAAFQGTPLSQHPEGGKLPTLWRPELSATSVHPVEEPVAACLLEGQDAYKANFSTPFGKGGGNTMPADGTTTLGMPTPSFGYGTGTFGKGLLPGGFKFDDTAHSAAGSSYLSQENGRETGYGHTSHSVGGRSSIGSSFRWQPSPTSLATRQLTSSVSSRGVAEKSRPALEGPAAQEPLPGETREDRKGGGGVGERPAEVFSNGSAERLASLPAGQVKHAPPQNEGRSDPQKQPPASRDWIAVLTSTGEPAGTSEMGEGSSGGSMSPTETLEVRRQGMPEVGGHASREEEGCPQNRAGTPWQGAGKRNESFQGLPLGSGSTVADERGAEGTAPSMPVGGAPPSESMVSSLGRQREGVQGSGTPALERPSLAPAVRAKGVPLERPLWMREPARKTGPTLSPVEESSRERASNTASSGRTGSKSSGSSSVKSAVTSQGDEETVSLSKPVAGPGLQPVAESEMEGAVAPPKAAAERSLRTPAAIKRGKQLRRLGEARNTMSLAEKGSSFWGMGMPRSTL